MNHATKDTRQLLQHWRESVPDDRLAHLIRDVARAQMRALQQRLTRPVCAVNSRQIAESRTALAVPVCGDKVVLLLCARA